MQIQRRDFLKTGLGLAAVASAVPRVAGQMANSAAPPGALFLPADRIEQLRDRLAGDVRLQARWKRFLAHADALTQERLYTFADATAGSEYNASFPVANHQLNRIAFTVGLAWRMTGDDRYAEALRKALKNAVSYQLWMVPTMLQRRPPWHSELSTAAFTIGCAAGLEALGDRLSADDRREVTAGMLRLGIEPLLRDWVLPETRIHALDSMGHNWWSVCVAGAGIGVLALLDRDERAADWLRRIDAAIEGFYDYQGAVLHNKPANFDPAGAFYESANYADYALASSLRYRLARLNALGGPPPEVPLLDTTGEFFVHALYPASGDDVSLQFGDTHATSDGTRALHLLAALGHQPKLARWYLQRSDPESIDPLALLYGDESHVEARNALPLSKAYYGIGWAMLRTAWAEDATLLAIRCGDSWNHAHADAGSFTLHHAGRPLLIDPGTCYYGRDEYLDYYVKSRAHNVVLFNGDGQPAEDVAERGAKFPGKLHDLIDGLGLRYVYADATGPMSPHFRRNYRHWIWLDGAILVFDDILAHRAGRFDWLLHYAGEAKSKGGTVDIINGPARARVVMLHPAAPAVHEERGLAPEHPDVSMPYLVLSTTEPAIAQKFIVAVLPEPTEAGVEVPKVELLQDPGMAGSAGLVGVRVRTKREITDVYLNLEADGRRMHFNSNQTIDGWETDAYMLALTRPADQATPTLDNITRCFVVFGSYLRREGRSVLDALSKVTTVFRPGDDIEVMLHGQPVVEVALGSASRPRSLRVNGAAMPYVFDSERETIVFKLNDNPPS